MRCNADSQISTMKNHEVRLEQDISINLNFLAAIGLQSPKTDCKHEWSAIGRDFDIERDLHTARQTLSVRKAHQRPGNRSHVIRTYSHVKVWKLGVTGKNHCLKFFI